LLNISFIIGLNFTKADILFADSVFCLVYANKCMNIHTDEDVSRHAGCKQKVFCKYMPY